MKIVKLNQVKKGEYLMRGGLSRIQQARIVNGFEPVARISDVWVKGDYIRETRKYSVTKVDDMNKENCLPGSALVWVGFTF